MRYKCALNDLKFHAFHGLYDEEKVLGGPFTVYLTVEAEKNDQAPMKDLDEVINYEDLYEIVRKSMAERQDLVETVARRILGRVEQAFSGIAMIEVKVIKHNPAGALGLGDAVVTLSKSLA